MQQYSNTFQNSLGRPVTSDDGAQIAVYTYPGNVLAVLYSDNGVTPKANPVTTDENGLFEFYAADGRYTLVLTSDTTEDVTLTDGVLLEDPADNTSAQISFTAAGTGAVTRTAQDKMREVVSIKDFGAVGDGATDDTAVIQAAINYALAAKCVLMVPPGTYMVSSLLIGSNLRMVGAGPVASIFKQTAVGAAILRETSSSNKSDIYIDSIGFDVNLKDSAINVTNVSSLTIRNCNFSNNPFWGIHVGIETARETTTTVTCEDVLIENCRFSNSTSTYEHIVLFNGKNMIVRDCHFVGAMSGGIGIGLYQNLRGVTITGCFFRDITKGLYYSVTTNEITIADSEFTGCTISIQGANESDHGLFGEQWVYGLTIDDCNFYANDWAVEVGSVRGASISNCHFERNISNALVFSYGNRLSTPTINQSVNINVSGCHFLNNNQSGVNHSVHPGILFNEGGGIFYGAITGCTFEDSQATKTQYYAVVFNGAFNWSGIRMFGCRLAYYSTGASLAVINSATVSDVRLYGCMDLSSLPAGVTTV